MKSKKSSEQRNRLILGNCVEKLRAIEPNTADLVYLDPPFFTQRTHSQSTRDNSKEFRFDDRWESLEDYLNFISATLVECQRVLKDTGSIFLHCDKAASHHLRIQLDRIFGTLNFQSEIIWSYKRWSNAKKGLMNAHQTIFFYSKTEHFKFNTFYNDYSATTNVDQILQARTRNAAGKSVYKRDEEGKAIVGSAKQGVPLSDVWEIPYLNPKAKERVGYPTQKPVLLLQRVVQIASEQGDLVLDPFCGSGTALIAAKLLNRDYIGIDISQDAIDLSEKRLKEPIVSSSALLSKGEEQYFNKTAEELLILKSLDAVPVQRNSGIDGFLKKNYLNKPIAVRIQKEGESILEAASRLCKSRKSQECELLIVVRTHGQSAVEEPLDFQMSASEKMVVLDSYDLLVQKLLRDRQLPSVKAATIADELTLSQ